MSQSYLISGQNVRIRQHLAGLAPRTVALVVDILIYMAYFYCLAQLDEAFHSFITLNEWLFFFIFICPIMFYFLLCEVLNNGQTVGKRLMNIRVVRLDGQPLTIGNSLMRFLLLSVDSLLGCGLGAVLIAVTPKSQRLGDLAAGTTVVSDRAFRASRVDLSEYEYLLKNYSPVFVRAAELTQKQADIIAHVLESKGEDRFSRLKYLASKVKAVVGNEEKNYEDAEAYLSRVLSDWRYYQMVE